jgi:hypothetical protein
MSQPPARKIPGTLVTVGIPVVILLIPLGYSIVSPLVAQERRADRPFLERPDPQYEACLRDTTYMRHHHWELLRTVREEVVRYGVRGDVGLMKCKECHTSRERFCNRCHDAVSLYPDCFDCHYYP